MLPSVDRWPHLRPADLPGLLSATEQIHRAAQFLAMAGKFLLPMQSDDSHTNMGWDIDTQTFWGHPLADRLYLGLQCPDLRLVIREANQLTDSFPLINQKLEDGTNWIRHTLAKKGLDTRDYKIDLHYKIPAHEIDSGATFRALTAKSYASFGHARTIGHLVTEAFATKFPYGGEIRTWPHHFDIGSYIPLVQDEAGMPSKSITIGLAIPDEYVDDYYFYITHWSAKGGVSYKTLVQLPACGYWNQQDFTGAILRLSDVIDLSDPIQQCERISVFMKEGILASLDLLSLDPAYFLYQLDS